MNRKQNYVRNVLTIALLAGLVNAAGGQEAQVLSRANAKGIIVLEASFTGREPLHSFSLEIKGEEEEFLNAKAGPLRGPRFAGSLVHGAHETDRTVLLVPVVARFTLGAEAFLFDKPGTYVLRWDIAFENESAGSLKIEQTIEVKDPRTDDLGFLSRIGDKDFVKRVFDVELPESAPADSLALGVISELLKHAQSEPSEEGPWGPNPRCGDALLELAKEFPESSYSAYSAYYAGGIFLVHLSQTKEGRRISPAVRNHALYRKADDALEFAIHHGDRFLEPRALCARAYLLECAGAWNEAHELLGRAANQAAGQGSIHATVERMRRQLATEQRSSQNKARD